MDKIKFIYRDNTGTTVDYEMDYAKIAPYSSISERGQRKYLKVNMQNLAISLGRRARSHTPSYAKWDSMEWEVEIETEE